MALPFLVFMFSAMGNIICDEAFAVTCFFKYEVTSGFNKICYYDCLGSLHAITISSTSLCPLTIAN